MKKKSELSYHFNVYGMYDLMDDMYPNQRDEHASLIDALKYFFNITVDVKAHPKYYCYTFASEDDKIEFFLKYPEYIKDCVPYSVKFLDK